MNTVAQEQDQAEAGPSQWVFRPSDILHSPSQTTSDIPLNRELYDRSRGVEFLFRLGSSLQLFVDLLVLFSSLSKFFSPTTALFTAATWFHRFYMRFSLEDYHRQVRVERVDSELRQFDSPLIIGCSGCLHFPGHKDGRVRGQITRCRENLPEQGYVNKRGCST